MGAGKPVLGLCFLHLLHMFLVSEGPSSSWHFPAQTSATPQARLPAAILPLQGRSGRGGKRPLEQQQAEVA